MKLQDEENLKTLDKKTSKAEDARKLILKKARELFLSNGYHKTSMREIAKATGISTGPLYFYFKNKAEVYTAICNENHNILISILENINQQNESALSKIKQMFYAYFNIYSKEPQYFEFVRLIGNSLVGIDIPAESQAIMLKKQTVLLETLRKVVEQGIQDGELQNTDSKKMVLYLYSLAAGLCTASNCGILKLEGFQIIDLIEDMANFGTSGIAK